MRDAEQLFVIFGALFVLNLPVFVQVAYMVLVIAMLAATERRLVAMAYDTALPAPPR